MDQEGHRGEMDDAAAAGNRVLDALHVSHVAFFVTRSSKVQSGDLRSARFERRSEGRSDQSFGAGDQYPVQLHALRQSARRPCVRPVRAAGVGARLFVGLG